MGYEEWWKTLENLAAEFKKKQVAVPQNIMTSLKSARTMINVYQADPTCTETVPPIESYLLDVESTLINMAKEKFGQDIADRWLNKLDEARREEPKAESTASRFIPGLPKSEHWIRILPSDNVLREDVERLANEAGLAWEMQKDGYIIVYGSKEKVKAFVRRMAEACRRTGKN